MQVPLARLTPSVGLRGFCCRMPEIPAPQSLSARDRTAPPVNGRGVHEAKVRMYPGEKIGLLRASAGEPAAYFR